MDKLMVRLTKLAGAALFALAGGSALAIEGYVTDDYGNVVLSGEGNCVYTESWAPSDAIPRCDPQLAEAEVAALQGQQPRPEAARTETRKISLDTDTNFGFDEAQLTAEGQRQLDQIAERMKQTRDGEVRVVGYADRIGPESYNEDLSRRRAEAVKDYLVEKGVPTDAIRVSARGESNPVVNCEGLSGQALIECLRPNRRSEVEFSAFEVVEESQEGGTPARSPAEEERPEQ